MAYSVAINFEDGVTRFIQCNPGEKVLDAAYRQQVNLPMDCSDGVCGTCKCHCEQGDYSLGEDYLEEALSAQEAARRQVLTCQMVPLSDCTLDVPLTSALCKTAAGRYQARVVAGRPLSGSAFELCLQVESEQGVPFLPGQYINIQVPGSQAQRAYSFSSRPGSATLSFLIRNVPDGLMSGYLQHNCRPGDGVMLSGPMGSFYLRPLTRPALFLAGGTGLAPFLAMLQQLAHMGCNQPICLIYGVTHDDDLVKLAALEAAAQALPHFSYLTVVADAQSQHPRRGYVTQHIPPAVLNDGEVDVYLCGPPPMVDAVTDYFARQNVTPANFYYEKFAPGQTAAPSAESSS